MTTHQVSREDFEKMFRKMNGSWAYEDAALSEVEKEFLFKRINGEISDEVYNSLFLNSRKAMREKGGSDEEPN